MTAICRKCNQVKTLDDFLSSKVLKSQGIGICLECVKERAREYDKKRGMLPHRVQARKDYAKTEAGREAKKVATNNYRRKNPLIQKATNAVNNAIRDGRLLKSTHCEQCNSTNRVEAHHSDYTKPLKVNWLCDTCHKAWHKCNAPVYE